MERYSEAIQMHPALHQPEPFDGVQGFGPPLKPARAYTRSMTPIIPLRLDTETAMANGYRAHTEWKPERKQWLTMISLSFISFAVSLDATILVTALPEISKSLRGSTSHTLWVGTSYLLTSAVFQPVIASASRFFGHQQLLVTSVTLFTFGTTICGIAHDVAVMLIGRCVQGVGGGGVIAMTQVIFSGTVPLRVQPKYFSMVLGSWSVGSIIGPVVGGSLVDNLSWRWCFYINFPFCGMGMVAALLFVRSNNNLDPSLSVRLRQMDWIGAILFICSTASFLIGISWGGTQHAWGSAATLTPILTGVLGIAIFLLWQVYAKPYSLLPTTILYNGSSIAAFYCALVNGFILFTALYYVPFYQMSVRGSSAVRAGIDLFPAVSLLVPGSVIVAILASRFGRFRWAIWIGWIITVLACGLFILFDEHTSKTVFAIALAVFGVGNGMVLTGVNVGTQAISKAENRAMAACMYSFMRSLGMPIGGALSGVIFQNAMSHKLSEFGLPVEIAFDSERYISVLHTMAKTEPRKIEILNSYTTGFHAISIAMTAIAASALLASLFIKRFNMNRTH